MAKAAGLGLEITELRLGFGSNGHNKKRVFSELVVKDENSSNESEELLRKSQPSENRVVGWPPIRSYRMKNVERKSNPVCSSSESAKSYVKISMDGAPFLRKIDLKSHKGYHDLGTTFKNLFNCDGGVLINCSDWSQYTAIYEDKDGDWMLVGDEPWEMFIESCKKLRIMKKAN
ncbi:hypothetical protein Syun_011213 [Stephania yunnanensis]|uniref:Auxin-responsive protein n=1 Tax=Stephania yunnanensis TaxID=152371 RepID=A0AAP0JYD4_9MAGN